MPTKLGRKFTNQYEYTNVFDVAYRKFVYLPAGRQVRKNL